jgi:hypothetical protein
VLLLLILKRDRSVVALAIMYASLFLAYLVRPSVLPIIVFIIGLGVFAGRRTKRVAAAALGACLLVAIALTWQPKQPWHTMYVGFGAYENKFVQGLSDETAHAVYKARRGATIDTNLFTGNYYNKEVRRDYDAVVRDAYLTVVRKAPFLAARNAVLNVIQSFSVGYAVKYPHLRIWSMLGGILVLSLLLWSRQLMLIAGILAASAGYVLYYPPIPAYMFGNYLLLAFGITKFLEHAQRRQEAGRSASKVMESP